MVIQKNLILSFDMFVIKLVGSYPSTPARLEKVSGKMIGLLPVQRLAGVALRYESEEFIMYIHRYEAYKCGGRYIWGSGQTSPEIPNKGTSGSKERTGVLQKL